MQVDRPIHKDVVQFAALTEPTGHHLENLVVMDLAADITLGARASWRAGDLPARCGHRCDTLVADPVIATSLRLVHASPIL